MGRVPLPPVRMSPWSIRPAAGRLYQLCMPSPLNHRVTDPEGEIMHRRLRLHLTAASAVAVAAVLAPSAVAAPQVSPQATSQRGPAATVEPLARPAFKMPFACGQTWRGSNWSGHKPPHSIDWNHYNASGAPDDFKRRVFASAGGTVIESRYATNNGYGNTIVIAHGDGWWTRYAHLYSRKVQKGAKVKVGQLIGRVGKTSATATITPHLHYEQIHNKSVVVAVVQGKQYPDFTVRYQKSKNRCG